MRSCPVIFLADFAHRRLSLSLKSVVLIDESGRIPSQLNIVSLSLSPSLSYITASGLYFPYISIKISVRSIVLLLYFNLCSSITVLKKVRSSKTCSKAPRRNKTTTSDV